MFWTVSFRNDLPVQILEDYNTGELRFNQTLELPYSQHEADCENQMGVINRWLERKKVAMAMLEQIGFGTLRQMYLADFHEATMCYEYNMRELDHLVRHHGTKENLGGEKRVHFIYYDHTDRIGMCETCDKIDAANVKHYHNYEPFYTARHTNEDLTVSMRDYVKCTKCDFVSYTVNA